MKINPELFTEECSYEIYHMLLNYFQYSIKDIDSYDELTKEEKEIFPESVFDYITNT